MAGVLSWLGEVPDRGLFPVSEPLVLSSPLPPVEHRFVLPLIRRASRNEGVFDPDTAARECETGFDERSPHAHTGSRANATFASLSPEYGEQMLTSGRSPDSARWAFFNA